MTEGVLALRARLGALVAQVLRRARGVGGRVELAREREQPRDGLRLQPRVQPVRARGGERLLRRLRPVLVEFGATVWPFTA